MLTDLELIVAKRVNPDFVKVDPFEYYGVKNRFLIKRIWLIDLTAGDYSLKGLSVIIQNFSFAVFAFCHLLLKKTDIIYSRDEFSLFLLCFFRKNLVWEMHTFPQRKFRLYKFLLKRLKKIVVITRVLKKLLVEKAGIEADKIIVCPDGVDLAQYDINLTKAECRQKLNLSADKNIILYSGHLFKWKGVYTLADAGRYLSDNEIIVFVGGMKYDREKLSAYLKENGIKNVILSGHVKPTLIPYYLKAADILALPNSAGKEISELYTSPMKLFEYMAAQRPIVASDLPSIREVLNENNSILIKPDDAKDLADGIKIVLRDFDSAQNLTGNSFKEVQKYAWAIRAEKIIDFIK